MSVQKFDEAINSKAKQIQWKCGDQFEDIILKLGRIFIEAGLYGSNKVCRFLRKNV